MAKHIFLFLISVAVFSQSRWQDYFSYKDVTHIIELNNQLYCASENGLFTYDLTTGELQKQSKVNDLNEVGITAFAYAVDFDFIMVGYETGELDFIGPDEVYNVIDIPLDDFQGSKQVNHITSYQDRAVLCGEFGVVTYDLERLEFDETAFFRVGGVFIEVNETAVLDGVIYAASQNGIYTHPLNDFIPNFPAWQQPAGVPTANFTDIVAFNNQIFAATSSQIYRYDGSGWSLFQTLSNLTDLNANNGVLTVTRQTEIRNFDASFNLTQSIPLNQNANTGIQTQSTTFAGTKLNGLLNTSTQETIFPDGPFNNKSYGVTAYNQQIFIAPGGAANYLTPSANSDGYSHFNTQEWIHNTSQELNGARDIIQITVNPTDTTEVWISTWNPNSNLLKVRSGALESSYDENNSAIKTLKAIGGTAFDSNGNLWVAQSFVAPPSAVHNLVSFAPDGSSASYDLANAISANSGGVNTPFVDESDNIYIPATRGGGVIMRSANGDLYNLARTTSEGDMPSGNVRNIAVDQNNTLWIATQEGLRVKPNPISSAESGDLSTQPIIIEQNGIAEELFFEVSLTDVVVDGANRKWIATEGAGVFYLSEDGQETLLRFNTANSPLPSNTVADISLDPFTGIVYFATARGVVSYASDAIETGNSFGNIEAYPNPVRPGFTGNVVIRGLANNASVRITDVVGNLMYRGVANGGILEWDTTNLQGSPVASGVYLVLMTNQDASETAYTKIAIVR